MLRPFLACIAIALVGTSAHAADPNPNSNPKGPGAEAPYEGRKLPDFVRELVWQKVCDLPQADANGCGRGSCPLVRTDGTPFKPYAPPWLDLLSLEWSAGPVVLSPALVEGKLATEADTSGNARTSLGLASGLGLASQPDSALFTINPTFVRWFERELLPTPRQAMCGGTAQMLYDLAFGRAARVFADTYAQLKQRGLLGKVSVAELGKNFDESKGRYMSACTAIGTKLAKEDDGFVYQNACWWWLRRAASRSIDSLAFLMARVVSEYDPPTYTRLRGALPKVAPRAVLIP